MNLLSALQHHFHTLKSNRFFELFVIFIIIVSALEIGAKTYALPEDFQSALNYLDVFVTLFFLVEICIRFIAEPNKRHFFKNGWNVFDTLVVIISLIPISDTEMVLIARLVRIFRVLRMVSVIPELRVLINSLLKALPQLGYVMLLMFIIFYIYGAVGSLFFGDINPKLWGNIAISLLTLFRVMTFEDWTDVMYQTMEVYPLSWAYYLSFLFFTAFAFLNMVIGIVVNVMEEEKSKGKPIEKDQTMEQLQTSINELKELIQTMEQNNKKD